MKIRSASIGDAYNISNLIERATLPRKEHDFDESGWVRFLQSNSESGVAAKLGEARRATLVAEDRGTLLGVISLVGGEKIDVLFVCPHHQRIGIGSRLWEAILSSCEVGESLWVRSSSAGVPFYKGLGFTTEGGRQLVSGIPFFLMKLKVNKLLNGDAAGGAR